MELSVVFGPESARMPFLMRPALRIILTAGWEDAGTSEFMLAGEYEPRGVRLSNFRIVRALKIQAELTFDSMVYGTVSQYFGRHQHGASSHNNQRFCVQAVCKMNWGFLSLNFGL